MLRVNYLTRGRCPLGSPLLLERPKVSSEMAGVSFVQQCQDYHRVGIWSQMLKFWCVLWSNAITMMTAHLDQSSRLAKALRQRGPWTNNDSLSLSASFPDSCTDGQNLSGRKLLLFGLQKLLFGLHVSRSNDRGWVTAVKMFRDVTIHFSIFRTGSFKPATEEITGGFTVDEDVNLWSKMWPKNRSQVF